MREHISSLIEKTHKQSKEKLPGRQVPKERTERHGQPRTTM